LHGLAQALNDPTDGPAVHQSISDYMRTNDRWLEKYLPDFHEVFRVNESFLATKVVVSEMRLISANK